MSDVAVRFAEDKALRDAALQLFKADLALVRGDLDERGVGARAKDRLAGAALEMLDDAIDYAEDNKGWIAAGTAALALWFARKPILGWVADWLDADAEPSDADTRSADNSQSAGDMQ